MFVLGIDPGLSRCGYAVVERRVAVNRAVAIGVITSAPSSPLPVRLVQIHRELVQLLEEYRPDAVAIERVLFQVNVRTAMSVGQVSGVAMMEAARRGLMVVEYSPNEVKSAVAGYGNATKMQMQKMVQMALRLTEVPNPPDAADAAAVALCHLAHTAGRAATNAALDAVPNVASVPGAVPRSSYDALIARAQDRAGQQRIDST